MDRLKLTKLKITNRLDPCCFEKLGQFKIQYQKKGSGSWLDCGSTYTLTSANKGGTDFPCVVNSDTDIVSVRVKKIEANYLHLAEVKIYTETPVAGDDEWTAVRGHCSEDDRFKIAPQTISPYHGSAETVYYDNDGDARYS